MQKHQIWTEEETQILLGVWENHNQRQISELYIPNKTPIQVNQKKMQMGLKKPPVWTEEERGLLLEHGANYTHFDLQQKFFPKIFITLISYKYFKTIFFKFFNTWI